MDNNYSPIHIDTDICNGCGRCVFTCAMGVIDIKTVIDVKKAYVAKPEYCMHCEACVIDCRRGAIKLNAGSDNLNIESISDMILKKRKKGK